MPPTPVCLDAGDGGRRSRRWRCTVLITTAGLAYFLAIGSLLPVLPRYVEDRLDGSGLEVGLVIGAFAVSAAVVRPSVGRLGDLLGRAMAVGGAGLAAISVARWAWSRRCGSWCCCDWWPGGASSLFFDLSQGLGAPLLGLVVTVSGAERPAFLVSAAVALVGLVIANTRLRAATALGRSHRPATG